MITRLGYKEQKAYKYIVEAGEKGILQSELWKLLGTGSKEGSRIAIRLERKNLISRKPVIHNGRKTYLLVSIDPKSFNSNPILLNSPCFLCPDIDNCGEGREIDPTKCRKLEGWLDTVNIDE